MRKALIFASVFAVVLSGIGILIFWEANEYKVVKDVNDLYAEMAIDCSTLASTSTYLCKFEMTELICDRLSEELRKNNSVVGGCLKEVNWSYKRFLGQVFLTVEFDYLISKTEMEQVRGMAKKIANNISHYTNAEKVKLVHDYLIIKNSYNVDKGGPFYGLFGGETNCSGYACAFMIIMDECGIPCTIEVADEHAWNMVFIDGSWYNVDITWDDNVNGIEQFAKISYMFFMKATDEWEGHSINNATAKEAYDVGKSFGKDVVGELLELNVA